jgi:hypothetical protein
MISSRFIAALYHKGRLISTGKSGANSATPDRAKIRVGSGNGLAQSEFPRGLLDFCYITNADRRSNPEIQSDPPLDAAPARRKKDRPSPTERPR